MADQDLNDDEEGMGTETEGSWIPVVIFGCIAIVGAGFILVAMLEEIF